jgi:lysophospholipid acyltransferase (LPLAT)-like uncharacterized protein
VTATVIRLLWASYRYRLHGEEKALELVRRGRPMILTLWHEDVFAMAWYLAKLTTAGVGVTYLVSPSADGEFAFRVLAVMGARSVRGSATRSGVKAMHGLYRAIVTDGGSPVVLPDGPQGPRHHCKPGSLILARMSGAHILPMACAARRAGRLRTWDRLLVPLPLSRVAVVLGDPYTVPSKGGPEELEEQRRELEDRLDELAREAARCVGR